MSCDGIAALLECLECRQLLSAGDLDSSFGSGGKYVPPAEPPVGHILPADMAVQSDGKILFTGTGLLDVAPVVRLNANGTLDTSFGNNGFARSGFGPYTSFGSAIAVGPGGKIAVGGFAGPYQNELPNQSTLVIYRSNGQLDTSFDGDGILNAPQFSRGFNDVIFQSDGKVLAVGQAVVRYNANGTIDKTFGGGNGVVEKSGKKLLIDSNGKILMLGDYALFRFISDGSLDTSFDGDGILPNVKGTDIAIAPDNDILVAGNGPTADLVTRFNYNGSVDLAFGSRGNVNVAGGRQLVATASDIYVGSTYTDLVLPYNDVQIRALLQSGKDDPAWPRVWTDFQNSNDRLVSLALQDGKLLALASSEHYFSPGDRIQQPAVARYDLGTTPPASTQTPYGGTAQLLPGTIGIATFDEGGEGVAYHDTDNVNYGGSKVRPGTGVDIKYTGNAFHPQILEMVRAGEWLEYTVNATVSSEYDIGFQVSHISNGGTFHLEVDGKDVTGSLRVPKTGAWLNYTSVVKKGVFVSAGTHVLRLAFDTNGDGASVGNFDNFSFSQAGPVNPQQPFRGNPFNDSQLIDSEDYDSGGEGIAYHDADAANLLGAHWRDDAVDIETTTDVGGGYNVGSMRPGEWLEYTVNFLQGGPFNLNVRAASQGNSGTFSVMIDGQKVATFTPGDTGGWQSWRTLTQSGINIAQGQHVVRFQMESGGVTGYTTNLNWFQFTKG